MIKSKIKICGIKDLDTIDCCINNNVSFFGLIFYKKSPRFIKFNKAIELIKYSKNKNIYSVGVFVNEPKSTLNQILKKLRLDYVQLHGDENNEYIKFIKQNNKVKVIKVIPIDNSGDLIKTSKYNNTDMFLFDYKGNEKDLPGGNAKTFEWSLINNIKLDKPWFLSGGININNINQIKNYAIPYGIDISSGVEVNPGIKSNEKIISLIKSYETA